MRSKYRYLDSAAEDRLERRAKRQKGWGIGLSIFFGLAVIFALTADKDEPIADDLGFYLGCLVPGLALLVWSFFTKSKLTAARRYAELFGADRDGFVELRELTRATGLSEQKLLVRLDRLFNAGLFCFCTLQRGGARPGVLLSDARVSDEAVGFVNVKCASCGGTSRIRAGTVGKCEYCGSPIRPEL